MCVDKRKKMKEENGDYTETELEEEGEAGGGKEVLR